MHSVLLRVICSAMAIVMVIGLLGCKYANLRGFTYDQIDQNEAKNQMTRILIDLFDAVKNDNIQQFDNFFADHVITLPDFKNGRDYVFDTYSGEIISIECRLPMITGENIRNDMHLFFASTIFDIVTSNDEYRVYVEFYTKDAETQYKIRKFKMLSKLSVDNGENFSDMGLRYGIYYSGWIRE